GTTMRTIKSLSKAEGSEILRIFRVNGTAPSVIANVGTQYRLDEASSAAIAQAFTEAEAKTKATSVTESGGTSFTESGATPRQMEAAEQLLGRSNRAEADLSSASISDLEAFAEMTTAQRAFGRR